jgi:magnesium transporter
MASSALRRNRRRRLRENKLAQLPGTLVYVGDASHAPADMTLLTIGKGITAEAAPDDRALQNAAQTGTGQAVYWLQVRSLRDIQAISRVGSIFSLHPLVQEDIVDTTQRTKLEDHGHYLFLNFKFPCLDKQSGERSLEQISIILGANHVITFQDFSDDTVELAEKRLQAASGEAGPSDRGAGKVFYAILDTIIDSYYLYCDAVQESYEALEEKILTDPTRSLLQDIMSMKHESFHLLKALRALKEIAGSLQRRPSGLLPQNIDIYLRDLYDHVLQLNDMAEGLREIMSVALDIYLSSLNNRSNGVIKFLTIFATLFMPLTFLTSLYGMNFKYMPELEIVWGYPALLLMMALLVIVMLTFFRRRKWL